MTKANNSWAFPRYDGEEVINNVGSLESNTDLRVKEKETTFLSS